MKIGLSFIPYSVFRSFTNYFFGNCDGFLITLISIMCFRSLSDLMCCVISKTFSSELVLRGTFKKIQILFLVGIGNLIDSQIIGTGSSLRTIIILFYIFSEVKLLLINSTILGLKLPPKLQTIVDFFCDS